MPEVHALLGASSAARWLACPPSARLNAALPEQVSAAALEGTQAHALAEQRLQAYLAGAPLDTDLCDSGLSEEMLEAVKAYTDICIEKITEARKASPDARIYVEHRLDYSRWVPEGFGTGDMALISDAALEVVDFKYGKGVRVEAEGNPQMRLYALGMLDEFGLLYDAAVVRMTIVQPRIDHIATAEMSPTDLLEWIAGKEATIHDAWAGTGPRHAGAHCRFCRARASCRALAEYELELVREDFAASDLTATEIAEIVKRAPGIRRWLTAAEDYALAQAIEERRAWPGLKVVAGRSVRKIADAQEAAKILEAAGYAREDVMKPQELKALTVLEKLVGRKKLAELLAPVIVKPAGKPALVPESDKRPAIEFTDLKDDFDDQLISQEEENK